MSEPVTWPDVVKSIEQGFKQDILPTWHQWQKSLVYPPFGRIPKPPDRTH